KKKQSNKSCVHVPSLVGNPRKHAEIRGSARIDRVLVIESQVECGPKFRSLDAKWTNQILSTISRVRCIFSGIAVCTGAHSGESAAPSLHALHVCVEPLRSDPVEPDGRPQWI